MISADIPLILGVVAGVLFIGVFAAALAITMRNRRIIQRHVGRSDRAVMSKSEQ